MREYKIKSVSAEVGSKIQSYMKENKITQYWLAKELGMSQVNLSYTLQGKYAMTIDRYYEICSVLKIRPEHLITEGNDNGE